MRFALPPTPPPWIGWILLLAAITGCAGSREAAKAAKQADQGVDATDAIINKLLAGELPDEARAALVNAANLLAQARRSLAPVIARLQVGEAPVAVATTAQQAAADPQAFIAASQEQAGRAWAEVDEAEQEHSIVGAVISYGTEVASGWSGLLTGGGLGGTALGLLAAWLKHREAKFHKQDAEEGYAKADEAQRQLVQANRQLPPREGPEHG